MQTVTSGDKIGNCSLEADILTQKQNLNNKPLKSLPLMKLIHVSLYLRYIIKMFLPFIKKLIFILPSTTLE